MMPMLWRLLLPLLALACTSLATTAAAVDDSEAREFYFYRAMPEWGIGKWTLQNFNLASAAGVIKYVHTEVIAEHIIGAPERTERKYGIDAFARIRFKVRNPGRVLDPENHLATQVDFGPFVTYDSGVATNPQTQKYIQAYGGYVGVQLQQDQRWPYDEPYSWFSVTGFCPNMRYDKIPLTREEYVEAMSTRDSICTNLTSAAECSEHASECLFVGDAASNTTDANATDANATDGLRGACVARDAAPQCLNHTAASGQSGKVLGGLCPGGVGNLSVVPSGDPSCTYSYGEADKVMLDKVAGIYVEDCGGRTCKSWLDFRHNCTNPDYKRKFNTTGSIVSFKYCVEYDIHPACQADCDAAACQALTDSEKELGLPYWRGICEARSNQLRSEFMRKLFVSGSAGADGTAGREEIASIRHAYSRATCVRQSPGICAPSPRQGGNYCTRRWAGVCANCYIPGTKQLWPATDMPYCPYNILATSDYAGRFPSPTCASDRARDLCCLYTGHCSLKSTSPEQVPLDEDGFALVASWGNSSAMAVFLQRVALEVGYTMGRGNMTDFAYTQWDSMPMKGASLEHAVGQMLSTNLVRETTPTTTSSWSTATATTTSSRPPAAENATTTTTATEGAAAGLAAPTASVQELAPIPHVSNAFAGMWSIVAITAGGLLVTSACFACCRAWRAPGEGRPPYGAQDGDPAVVYDEEAQPPPLTDTSSGARSEPAPPSLPRLGLSGRSEAMATATDREGHFVKPPQLAHEHNVGLDQAVVSSEGSARAGPEHALRGEVAIPSDDQLELPRMRTTSPGPAPTGGLLRGLGGAAAAGSAEEGSTNTPSSGSRAEHTTVGPDGPLGSEPTECVSEDSEEARSEGTGGSSTVEEFETASSAGFSDYDTVGYIKI